MLPILIATTFSCSDAQVLVDRMKAYKIEEETKFEMIQVVKEEMSTCNWDAQVDWRNGAKIPTTLEKPNGKSHL